MIYDQDLAFFVLLVFFVLLIFIFVFFVVLPFIILVLILILPMSCGARRDLALESAIYY
jgi:hypothetical protein